ncbi:hypothetical protein SeMB42_g03473 [Synchytrium endobioticum]|uniref:Uncharacterized protein n=2 Tax=Synchytrium endobioticum TaxID=286115 RepID=A0A507D6E9_9FUNG|nr:hypothetical protein SeMB42_g03473 [Synchytrium endobioticum]
MALANTEKHLKDVAMLDTNSFHMNVYVEQEKIVLTDIVNNAAMKLNYLMFIIKGNVADMPAQMGTLLIAPRHNKATLPISFLLAPPAEASSTVSTGTSVPRTRASTPHAEGMLPTAQNGRTRFEYDAWNGKSHYDEWVEGFEVACRMSGIVGDAMFNTFLSRLPEGTRHQAKYVIDNDGRQTQCKTYRAAKANYRASIFDSTIAGGLNNATKAISCLKMQPDESYQEYIDRSLRIGDSYKQNRFQGYMNESGEFETENQLAAAWTNADLVHHIMSGFSKEVQDELEAEPHTEVKSLKKALSTFSRVYKCRL